MGERPTPQPCGCPPPPLGDLLDLLDPDHEVVIELDARDRVIGGFPHVGPLLAGALCQASELAALLPAEVASLIADRARVVRAGDDPSSFAIPGTALRARVARRGAGVAVLLRGESQVQAQLARETVSDESFWQLFEAAPLPLAIELAKTTTGEGASRLNRRFTELFGYTAADIPTVQHWWPRAYPDVVYREQIRAEWFRRLNDAVDQQGSIEPMQATVTCKDGSLREIEFFAAAVGDRHVVVFVDLTERNRSARQLQDARAEVRSLADLLPVCAWCKKLRDDQGYWQKVEEFVTRRTGLQITHGICPDCTVELRAHRS